MDSKKRKVQSDFDDLLGQVREVFTTRHRVLVESVWEQWVVLIDLEHARYGIPGMKNQTSFPNKFLL